jgi:TPR repeat protein
MYGSGVGVAQDDAQAREWYLKSAEQGDVKAEFNLAHIYEDGVSAPADPAQALAWYRKAADQGYAKAQHNLGLMYGKGEGVQQSDLEAYEWFSLAVANYPADDADDRAEAGRNRDVAASRLTPDQLAVAQGWVAAWKAAPAP